MARYTCTARTNPYLTAGDFSFPTSSSIKPTRRCPRERRLPDPFVVDGCRSLAGDRPPRGGAPVRAVRQWILGSSAAAKSRRAAHLPGLDPFPPHGPNRCGTVLFLFSAKPNEGRIHISVEPAGRSSTGV
jgi:hypothetical protein